MAKRLISGWLWLWFCLLQNGSTYRLRTSGSLTAIRLQLAPTTSMPGSSLAGHRLGCISSAIWDNSCYKKLEATSVIWNGVTDLTGNGERRTRQLPCVLLGVATTRQMNTYCGSGYVYITQSGLSIYGQKDARTRSKRTAAVPRDTARAYCPKTSLQRQWTYTPWTRGPLPLPKASLPSSVCIGKTGRMWRGRQSQLRRRSRHRRRAGTHATCYSWRRCVEDMLHFLFMNRAALCPLQHYLLWNCLLRQNAYKLTQQLPHPLDVFWAQSGCSYCEMAPRCWWLHMSSDGEDGFPDGDGRSSDSSEILRRAGPPAHIADGSTGAPAPSTPGGTPLPPGPPPPRPVTELMSVSVRLSTAISQAFAELGHPLHQILTYVPWQYHDLQSVVVRIEPMLPGHVFHPRTLVVDADELGPENNEEARERRQPRHSRGGRRCMERSWRKP